MEFTPLPTAIVDLEALGAFLLSDGAPINSMGLSDLDGFLTGVVIGPEMILPSEWMPFIWGGDEPEFADIDEAQTVLGTIMGRYNEIIAKLRADSDAFDPIFLIGRDDQVIVTDWAAGFLDAVKLRVKAWEPLIGHPEARVLMMPLLVLGAEDDEHPPFGARPLPADKVEELLVKGAEIIPACVIGIHTFWQSREAQLAPKPTRSRRRPEPHRRRR
jgi:uncharacterized protein